MSSPASLRTAADYFESTVASEREEQAIELMAYHILHLLGDEGHEREQARPLCW